MSRGDDAKPNAEPVAHHLDDADNYIQVCNFSNFITILLNYVTNSFIQQVYTLYGPPPPPFPRPTTLGNPSTPHVDSSQVN
jgi:hypothetical protein